MRRGSISAPAPPKRGRGAQIFPRAKARNRGHSSSWEGPRAPHSLPRSVHPGTKKKTTTPPGLRCTSLGRMERARGAVASAGPARSRLTKIVIPRSHARLSKHGRLIRVSFLTEFRHTGTVPNRMLLLFHAKTLFQI